MIFLENISSSVPAAKNISLEGAKRIIQIYINISLALDVRLTLKQAVFLSLSVVLSSIILGPLKKKDWEIVVQ